MIPASLLFRTSIRAVSLIASRPLCLAATLPAAGAIQERTEHLLRPGCVRCDVSSRASFLGDPSPVALGPRAFSGSEGSSTFVGRRSCQLLPLTFTACEGLPFLCYARNAALHCVPDVVSLGSKSSLLGSNLVLVGGQRTVAAHSEAGEAFGEQTVQGLDTEEAHTGDEAMIAVVEGSGEGKVCIECEVWKPLRNFGRLASSLDRRQVLCRACDAKVRARQAGRELHHLAMPVADAWARAKKCTECSQVQEMRDFYPRPFAKDRLTTYCRSCHSERRKRLPPCSAPDEAATCTQCWQEKPAAEFVDLSRSKRNGLMSICRACNREKAKNYNLNLRNFQMYIKRRKKVCTRCGVNKPVESFNRTRNTRDGLQRACKSCKSIYRKQSNRRRGSKMPPS